MKNRKYCASESIAYPIQKARFNLLTNHVIGLLRLDITNCDFIKNAAHDVY